jgi:glycosyltransferase involved in cell wall biosynthesis
MLRRIVRDFALRVFAAVTRSRFFWPLIRILPRSFRQQAKDTFHAGSQQLPLPVVESRLERWLNAPLLSVVVLCYNYGQYIREALQSLASQTFRDFQVIVVDDGSTDEQTVWVLEELRREGVRVLRQEHSGTGEARNYGISMAIGKYVCTLDADDTVEPTYFEKCLALVESNPGVTFVYPLLKAFGAEHRIGVTKPFDLRLLLAYNHVAASAIFLRAAWTAVGGFDSSMPAYVDWEFWIRLAEKGYRGRLIPEPLFNWRRHSRTLGGTIDEKRPELVARIRASHADLYSHSDRIRELQAQYRDLYVPNPFVNLANPGQYANLKEPAWLVIVTEPPQPEALSSLSELREGGVNLLSIATCPNLSEAATETYNLDAFLDPQYWLGFVINFISTRSIQLIIVYGSDMDHEWSNEIKNRFPSTTILSLHNPKRDPVNFRQERATLMGFLPQTS